MKRGKRRILRFLSIHNPFYLLSALMMLVGCFLIVNPWEMDGRKLSDVFLTTGVLSGYEIAVIIMAIVLHRLGKANRDVGKLVFVALIFLFDCVFMADAFAIAGGQYSFYYVLIMCVMAYGKLTMLLIGLQVKIEWDSLVFLSLSVAMVFAAPIVISQCIHTGVSCEAGMFYLWVAYAGVVLAFSLYRYFAARTCKLRSSFWCIPVTVAFMMGVVHLVTVGLELEGGFSFAYIAPMLCIAPLVIRNLTPSILRRKEVHALVDSIPGVLILMIILPPSKGGVGLLTDILSYRVTVTTAFAVTGFLSLKERKAGSLVWGGVILFMTMMDSGVIAGWGGNDLLLLFSCGITISYISAVLFVRRRERYSLSALVAGGNLLLAALFAGFGMASFFVHVQHTGLAILALEFVLWRDSNPLFRNIVAGSIIVVACAYMAVQGGTYFHVYAAAETGSLLALSLWLRLDKLLHVSAVGSAVVAIKLFGFAWPETMRGWGILLAVCASAVLAFGFWLSFRNGNIKHAASPNARSQ